MDFKILKHFFTDDENEFESLLESTSISKSLIFNNKNDILKDLVFNSLISKQSVDENQILPFDEEIDGSENECESEENTTIKSTKRGHYSIR